MLNGVEHMNFFEGRATEYSKASTKGSWGEGFCLINNGETFFFKDFKL